MKSYGASSSCRRPSTCSNPRPLPHPILVSNLPNLHLFLEVLFTSIKFILMFIIIIQFMAIMEVGHRRFQLLPGSSLVRVHPHHHLAVSLSRLAVSLGSNLCHIPLL